MLSKPLSYFQWRRKIFKLLSPVQRKEARKHITLSIFLACLEVVSVSAIFPLFFRLVTNQSYHSRLTWVNKTILLFSWETLLICIVAVFVLKNAASGWLVHRQLKFLNLLYLEFSEQVYCNFYRLDWVMYSRENSAETFRKIKNTAFDFTNNVLSNYYILITDLFTCMLMTCFLIWIDYRIIFILLTLCLPITLFYFFLRTRITQKIDSSFRKLTPQANIILSQGIEGFAEARIYKKEKYFIQRFIDISTITTSQLATLKTFSILPSRLLETMGIVIFSSVVVYVKLYPAQEHNIIVLTGLLSLALYRIIPSLNRALQSLSQIQAYSYSITELDENLTDQVHSQTAQRKLTFEQAITVNNLSFSYPQTKPIFVLKKASATIMRGDFVLLEGTSGAGKTTLLYLLAGLIKNYSGEIIIDNTPLTPELLGSWQEKLALVQQSPIVLQNTIFNNICFGETKDAADMEKVERAIKLAGIHDFIHSLPAQLDTPVGEHGLTLSGGQRQRLCLARALYRDPEVLLLDEVTNQLDEDNKLFVLKMLRSLSEQGKTVVLSSHDPTVKRYASRILRLEHGVLRENEVFK